MKALQLSREGNADTGIVVILESLLLFSSGVD